MTIERVERERAKGDAGFTLVEVVVALALLAMIMALLAESIRGARRVLALVERNTAANAVVAAQSYLRSALAQSVPAPNDGNSENQDLGFSGGPNSVRFTTTYAHTANSKACTALKSASHRRRVVERRST